MTLQEILDYILPFQNDEQMMSQDASLIVHFDEESLEVSKATPPLIDLLPPDVPK